MFRHTRPGYSQWIDFMFFGRISLNALISYELSQSLLVLSCWEREEMTVHYFLGGGSVRVLVFLKTLYGNERLQIEVSKIGYLIRKRSDD